MMNPLKHKLIRLKFSFALIAMMMSGIFQISAQPGIGISYNFSAITGVVTPPALTNQVVPAANQDDFGYRFTPAGMNIRFQGRNYTSFVVSTNGWLALLPTGTPAGIPASLSAGAYLANNQISNNTSGFPILAPYWDDLSCTILQYNWTAPVLTVQWFCRINKTAGTAAANFLLRIDGNTGIITYSYANNAYAVAGPPSASIGVAGECTGDYYSYDNVSAFADSTLETSTIAVKPNNAEFIFTPYQLYDNCASAKDLGTITGTCTPVTVNINNAVTSGSSMPCSPTGTDVADVWVKFAKPAGITSVTITSSSAAPACQSVAGTSIEAYAICGGAAITGGCATTGSSAGFGELILNRPSCAETLYIRVTPDGDIGGKFNICASGTSSGSTGNTCASAVSACAPLPFDALGLTTQGTVNDYSDNVLCQSDYMTGQDYVFTYTPPISQCVDISIDGTGLNSYPGLFILDGCPKDTDIATCVASSMNPSDGDTINNLYLTGGHTYYIVVDNDSILSANNYIPFNLHIRSNATSAPSNDNCGSAASLGTVASNATCNWSATYTTKCATPSPLAGYPQPYCGGFTAALTNDVWFTFTAGYTGVLQISGRGIGATPVTHGGFAIYTGSCGSLTLVGCAGDSVSIPFQPVTSIPVTNLQIYYIRYFSATGYEPGEFQLCFQANCAPPNDLPVNAIPLTLGVPLMGDNTCSTGLTEMANPVNCTTAPINTVWFRLIAPPSGQVAIRISQLSLLDAAVAAFLFPTGVANCASSFTPLACNDDIIFAPPCPICGLTGDNDAAIQFSTVPGNTVWVAVDGEFSAVGSFWITAIEGTLASTFPPLFRKDCGNPETICANNDYTIPNGGIGSDGNVCDFLNLGCASGGISTSEVGSSWMQFTVQAGSSLGFTITPNDSASPIANFNFYLWDITSVPNICATLSSTSPVRCNTAPGIGKTGMRNLPTTVFSDIITPQATARTYMLYVQNLTAANDDEGVPGTNTGFVLNWDIYVGGVFSGRTIMAGTSNVCNWTGTVTDIQYTNVVNWKGVGTCPAPVPTCATDVNISAATQICTANGNVYAKNIVINAGGTLTLNAGANLHVCGDFTNNGTLNALPGSTITFEGSVVQTINGNLTGANSMASLVINKLNSTLVTLNANLDLKQNFTTSNATSVFNINRKYMKVGGNFFNYSGTTTFPIALLGGSTIEFNGSINQNFTNQIGSMNLNRVFMNKTGGKLYMTTVNSNMNIDSTLQLTGGIIVTRAFPSLEVNMKYYLPAALIGPLSAASYIDGKLRRKISNGLFSSPPIPASYDFPVGDSIIAGLGGYENANITFTSATLVTDLLATFTPWPAVPATGPPASECFIATYDLLPIFNNGYWTFLRTGTNVSGRYTVTLNNTGFTNNLGAGWTVARCDLLSNVALPPSWTLTGTCVVPGNAPGNTQRQLINPTPGADSTSFNLNFATVQSPMPLPIELLYFTAEPQGEKVLCKWETATEINNEYFDVERSEDGKSFEFVGKVSGFGYGTSTEKREYSLTDNQLCNDVVYYRLKQVDFDGKFTYSDVVALNCNAKAGLTVRPNPAQSIVTVSFAEPADGIVELKIIDYIGRVVLTKEVKAIKGYNQIPVSIENLSEGVYYLDARSDTRQNSGETRRIRFIKN